VVKKLADADREHQRSIQRVLDHRQPQRAAGEVSLGEEGAGDQGQDHRQPIAENDV